MDARITFPTTHSAAIEAIRLEAIHERDAKLGQWFRNLFAAIIEYPGRRRAMEELALLNDRELADIGLNRSDIRHIFTLAPVRPATQAVSATVHVLPVAQKTTVNPTMVTLRSDRIAA